MPKRFLSKTAQKQIAEERVRILFEQADQRFSESPVLANRYVALARKIAMKAQLSIPGKLKRKFCKHCYHYLRAGVNARVRTRAGKVVISCFSCKKFMRIPLQPRRK